MTQIFVKGKKTRHTEKERENETKQNRISVGNFILSTSELVFGFKQTERLNRERKNYYEHCK